MPRTRGHGLQSLLLVLGCLAGAQGCQLAGHAPETGSSRLADQTAAITLTWQRLVDETGHTCGRCGATEQAIAEAESQLVQALAPVGLRVEVLKKTLTPAAFADNPGESNRIWIDGRPLEDLLGGTIGKSACCDACGDRECRTLIVDGATHEAISARLIVRAGLIAAAARLSVPKGEASGHAGPGTPSGAAGTAAPCSTTGSGAPCCTPGSGAASSCCASQPAAGSVEARREH